MDMVAMSVLDSTMVSICREMGITLQKTSYSTIFNEALDFTCGLADKQGNLIAVADFCPAMIGGIPLLVKSCLKEIDTVSLKEGDIILHNDPYRGGLHTPEHTFFKPIFSVVNCKAGRLRLVISLKSAGWCRAVFRGGHRDFP